MRNYWNTLVLVAVALVAGCTTHSVCNRCRSRLPPSHYEALQAAGCRVITLDDLTASLPDSPLVVGFDVDDTVLFSSPGFYYADTNTDGVDGSNLFAQGPQGTNAFWEALNTKLDGFSIPKVIARKLMALHRARGDEIHFITARPCPSGDTAPLTKRLNQVFGLANQHPVVFTHRSGKTSIFQEKRIQIFYGDSDREIKDAMAIGIRAIRVVRSPLSTNPSVTHDGAFGEEVLFESDH